MRRAQNARSKARTVDGAAAQRRARIKLQGRVGAPAAVGRKKMGGLNAAIDVGKHQLEVALGRMAICSRSPTRHVQLRAWPSGSLSLAVSEC